MRLKELRLERGLSQKDVADALACSITVYSRYETGSREPSIDVLVRLADFYGVTLDELVGRTPMPIIVTEGNPPPLDGNQMKMTFTLDDPPAGPDELEQRMRDIIEEEFKKRGL